MQDKNEIIKNAKKETFDRFRAESQRYSNQEKLTLSCRILHANGHTYTDALAGQITCRDTDSKGDLAMWTQPFGLGLDEIRASDYLLIDRNLNVLKGSGFANKANNFHLFVYDGRPDINAIVHSHPPYISTLAILGEPVQIQHMDTMGLYDDVAFLPQWPGVPFSDEEGEIISAALGSKNAILLAHHGLLAVGRTIEEACYRAYYLEKAAQMQVIAMSTQKTIKEVDSARAFQARDWKMSEGPVLSRYYCWAREVLRNDSDCLQ